MKYLVLLLLLTSCINKPPRVESNDPKTTTVIKITPKIGECYRFSRQFHRGFYIGRILQIYSDNSVRITWVDSADNTYWEEIGANIESAKLTDCQLFEDLKAISKPYVEPVEIESPNT